MGSVPGHSGSRTSLVSSKHKLGLTALSHIPSGRELRDFIEGMYARQFAKAKTDQDKVEIAAWIRASRENGNGRGK